MVRVVEAIYENGTLKPLGDAGPSRASACANHDPQASGESPDETLEAWHQVYKGCAEEEIAQVEAIALDRSRFMRQEP